jgi:hypothetical protein
VPLLAEELCSHAAEAVGRACDEHTRHYLLPLSLPLFLVCDYSDR